MPFYLFQLPHEPDLEVVIEAPDFQIAQTLITESAFIRSVPFNVTGAIFCTSRQHEADLPAVEVASRFTFKWTDPTIGPFA